MSFLCYKMQTADTNKRLVINKQILSHPHKLFFMKIYLIAQMQKVFAFFLLFAALDASFNDGIVSQSITNNGSEPIVRLTSTDKSYYLEKKSVGAVSKTTTNENTIDNESLALNSNRNVDTRSEKERHRFVLPVVKITTAHPEY